MRVSCLSSSCATCTLRLSPTCAQPRHPSQTASGPHPLDHPWRCARSCPLSFVDNSRFSREERHTRSTRESRYWVTNSRKLPSKRAHRLHYENLVEHDIHRAIGWRMHEVAKERKRSCWSNSCPISWFPCPRTIPLHSRHKKYEITITQWVRVVR